MGSKFIVTCFILQTIFISGSNAVWCDAKYSSISPQHSMCLDPKVGATPIDLTANSGNIVNFVNYIRMNARPPAGNMQLIYWMDDLATMASNWASQCQDGHEVNNLYRSLPDLPGRVSQNVEKSPGEEMFMKFMKPWITSNTPAGVHMHSYRQWTEEYSAYYNYLSANTRFIGCGMSHCTDSDSGSVNTFFVCNFYPAAPVFGNNYEVSDTHCASCPHICTRNSCDCKKIICKNGGQLNTTGERCVCDCVGKYTGDTCEEELCTGRLKKCLNYGTFDYATCQCACLVGYSGDTCHICPVKNVFDNDICEIEGMCNNANQDLVMENCAHTCNHYCIKKYEDWCLGTNTTCFNMGKFDFASCRCICVPGYDGDHCEFCPPMEVEAHKVCLALPTCKNNTLPIVYEKCSTTCNPACSNEKYKPDFVG